MENTVRMLCRNISLKVRVLPITGYYGPSGTEDVGGVVGTTPRPLYPGKDPVPIVQ